MELPDDVFVCNCAECGQLLIGKKSSEWWKKHKDEDDCPPLMATRICGRPYCSICAMPRAKSPGRSLVVREDSPFGENAIRALEDAPGAFD